MGSCFSALFNNKETLSELDPEDAKDANIINIIDIILSLDTSSYPIIQPNVNNVNNTNSNVITT